MLKNASNKRFIFFSYLQVLYTIFSTMRLRLDHLNLISLAKTEDPGIIDTKLILSLLFYHHFVISWKNNLQQKSPAIRFITSIPSYRSLQKQNASFRLGMPSGFFNFEAWFRKEPKQVPFLPMQVRHVDFHMLEGNRWWIFLYRQRAWTKAIPCMRST